MLVDLTEEPEEDDLPEVLVQDLLQTWASPSMVFTEKQMRAVTNLCALLESHLERGARRFALSQAGRPMW